MVYENCKTEGPYKRKDGRLIIMVTFPGEKRKTVSYPKYLLECYIGRYLEKNETVDHIDCNKDNNNIENLRAIDRRLHYFNDKKRLKEQEFICPVCESEFALSGDKLRVAYFNRKADRAGPFCGRKCVGKYSAHILSGGERLEVEPIELEYTTYKEMYQDLDKTKKIFEKEEKKKSKRKNKKYNMNPNSLKNLKQNKPE